MSKFIFTPDWHLGYEFKRVSGTILERQKAPTHNKKLISAFWKFVNDWKPDHIIFGGDQLNCGPVSHWHNGKPKLIGDLKIKEELDLLEQYIVRPFESYRRTKSTAKAYALTGNHEDFIRQWLDTHPELEGMIPIQEIYENAGITVLGLGEVLTLGKLSFTHGDVHLRSSNYVGANAAAGLAVAYNRNIRAGHIHSFKFHTAPTAIDNPNSITAGFVPCLCNLEFDYGLRGPNACLNGFNFGYIDDRTGIFNDYVVIAVNNKFTVEGKTYAP